MGQDTLRGVNLGGWLVLEKWMTPGLFKGVDAGDEYTYCQKAGGAELARLKNFRDTWITRDDFVWLAAHGVQAVRLPVGYWLFGGKKPYLKTVHYADKAFRWAEETGLRILVDLHGVVGSQNGKFHSGRAGAAGWPAADPGLAESLRTVERLAKRYRASPALLGISLLNEPSPDLPERFVLDFYRQAYHTVRDTCGEDTWVVYSQGFRSRTWRKAMRGYKNLFIDYHHYQNFRLVDRWLPARLQLLRARWQLPLKLAWIGSYHPVIVGEWSSLYAARNKQRLGQARAAALQGAYAAAQQRAFKGSAAHFYWSYKTEYGGSWNFRDRIEKGLL